MAASTLSVSRSILALGSILIAAGLSSVAATAPRRAAAPNPVDSVRDISDALFNAGAYDSLYRFASRYARRAEASGDSVLLGRAITQRGRALMMLGRPGFEKDMDAGIHIAESVRDTFGLMPAVNFRGFAYAAAQRYPEAMQCYARRLMLAQKTHSPVDEAWARTSLGFGYHMGGDQTRARDEYMRALALFRAHGAKRLEVTPLIGLGRVEGAVGNGPAAIRWYEQAYATAREVGDKMNEMWAANNISSVEANQGDLSRAWDYLQRAMALARELKSPSLMAVPAGNLSLELVELGDFETAESVLVEARSMAQASGATDLIAAFDQQLADIRVAQGRYASASIILRRLIKNPEGLEAQHRDYPVMSLARILSVSDSTDAAIELMSGYLKTHDGRMYGSAVPTANLVLGYLYADAGRTHEALESARRARATAITSGQKRAGVAAMLLESKCLAATDPGMATTTFYAALDSMDAARGVITTPQWREVYGQRVAQDVVESGHVLLVYPESSSRAVRERAFFDAIQRVKTRALLDRINRPRTDAPAAPSRLSARVAALKDLQPALSAGEVVLDFAVGLHRSYLAAVTPDSLRIIELPGPGSPLSERVTLLRTVLASTDPSLRAQYDTARLSEVQRALGRDVLGGVADLVDGSTRVFLSPDGYFAALPFGLLITRDHGDVLMKEHDVVQVPSASVLVMERAQHEDSAHRDLHVVAISNSASGLSGARAEVQDLAHRYRNVDHMTDLRNTDAFAKAASHGDVLHIASHALVVDRSPWWSGIALTSAPAPGAAAQDSMHADPYVRAWQIAGLDIPARLAVLSACETAGGRMTTGEGTIGLTTAFLSAGVPTIVSSLWPVDDRVTAIIMRSFYHHLAEGESVATALRHAQMEISGSPRYSHPFYWSGFTVVGDGSMVVPIRKRLVSWSNVLEGAGILLLLAAVALSFRGRRTRAGMG